MFFIIISGALTLSSAVTLAFLALRAPEAYETEHGLQVVHRIPKQRDSNSCPKPWSRPANPAPFTAETYRGFEPARFLFQRGNDRRTGLNQSSLRHFHWQGAPQEFE